MRDADARYDNIIFSIFQERSLASKQIIFMGNEMDRFLKKIWMYKIITFKIIKNYFSELINNVIL